MTWSKLLIFLGKNLILVKNAERLSGGGRKWEGAKKV